MHANRRTLFALIAAPFAVASVPALAAAHPDAALLELERQRLIALGAYDRLSLRADELDTQARAAFPPEPSAMLALHSDWFGLRGDLVAPSGHYSGNGLRLLRAAVDGREAFLFPIHPGHVRRVRAILAAADRHATACEAVMVATGARDAEDLSAAACHVLGDIEDRILTTRATTPEGHAIKARMVAYVLGDEPDGTREDWAARAFLADFAPVAS